MNIIDDWNILKSDSHEYLHLTIDKKIVDLLIELYEVFIEIVTNTTIDFEPYNESTIFVDVIERYRKRTGHYPKRVLVDKIYRTRDNLRFCKDNHIEISGPRLGRPAEGMLKA